MAGRNAKTNFDFFRLNTDFFSNKKIKALRRRFGSVGILTYLYILSYAYGNDGYFIRIDSVEEFAYDIAESIASSNINQNASVATDCINYLASRGEINKHLLDKGVISGESIQRQYIEMCLASKRKVELKEEYRLVDTLEYPFTKNAIYAEEMPISAEEIAINAEEMQQSKINKSKYKERKKEIKKEQTYMEEPPLRADGSYDMEYFENHRSHASIMDEMYVTGYYRKALEAFLRHCHLNGRTVLNDKLVDIICRLQDYYGNDDVEKIKSLERAVSGGYFDIKEGKV